MNPQSFIPPLLCTEKRSAVHLCWLADLHPWKCRSESWKHHHRQGIQEEAEREREREREREITEMLGESTDRNLEKETSEEGTERVSFGTVPFPFFMVSGFLCNEESSAQQRLLWRVEDGCGQGKMGNLFLCFPCFLTFPFSALEREERERRTTKGKWSRIVGRLGLGEEMSPSPLVTGKCRWSWRPLTPVEPDLAGHDSESNLTKEARGVY